MPKYKIENIKGVIPAMQTIFDINEDIDEESTRKFTNFLIESGVNGLYLTGSTGEGFLMNNDERKFVVETVCDETRGRVPIIVHVGDIGTRKSIKLAQQAYEAGADAVSSVPPFYWDFTEESIYNYYSDLSMATPLPMIVYNIPSATVLGIGIVEKLATIPNVRGIKYTMTKHHEIAQMKDSLGDDFMVYSGCDEMALSGLLNGADGIIGSSYNAIPELFIGIYNSVLNGDMDNAVKKQRDAVRIITYSAKHHYHSLLRQYIRLQGIESGYCRKPFINISEDEFELIKTELKKMQKQFDIKDINFLKML